MLSQLVESYGPQSQLHGYKQHRTPQQPRSQTLACLQIHLLSYNLLHLLAHIVEPSAGPLVSTVLWVFAGLIDVEGVVSMSSITSDSNETRNAPQEVINEFWESLITKKPGKVTKVFTSSLYANLLPPPRKPG